MPSDDENVRLYGPWAGRGPQDAAALLEDYPGPWWIAGGWAIEAFTGVPRPHGDLDIGIPRTDVPLLLAHLQGRLHVWAAAGSLTPLTTAAATVANGCGNLWLRASGADPWEYDVLLERVDGSTWTYKRDPRIRRPLDEALWRRDGLVYLRPEVQLLLKAVHTREKDNRDLASCLPVMDQTSKQWLAETLSRAHPEHPWLRRLPAPRREDLR